MKFAGNVSFINVIVLSKFQSDWVTVADFRNFTYIGKFEIFIEFSFTKKAATFFYFNIF